MSQSSDFRDSMEAAGHTVLRGHRFRVVEDENGKKTGLDESGEPEEISPNATCYIPSGKAAKVYYGSSKKEMKDKIAAKTPDIEKTKKEKMK